MSGIYGSEEEPLDIATELAHLQPRTSDPAVTQPAIWYRSDLDASVELDGTAQQFATLRYFDGSTTHDIPIVEPNTADEDVYEALQMHTGQGTGYVPISPDGVFGELRIQHAGDVMYLHDDIVASVIPDSVVFWPESDDLSEFSGDTGQFDINDTPPTSEETGQSLKIGDYDEIVSTEGLQSYPQPEDRFSIRAFSDIDETAGGASIIAQIGFNAADIDNIHLVTVDWGSDQISIFEKDDGDFNQLNSEQYTPPTNESLYVIVEWQSDNTIIEEIYLESQDPEEDTPEASVSAQITPHETDGNPATGVAVRGTNQDEANVAHYDYWIRKRGI